MKAIETPTTDTTFGGVASKGILELPTETLIETLPDRSIVRVHRSTWELEPAERAAVMLGSKMILDVFGEALPPMRLAILEPELVDPETVYRLVDQAIEISVGTTITAVLRSVGVDRDVLVVAAWSDETKKAVGDWLRTLSETSPLEEAPAELELSEEELGRILEARTKRDASDG